MDILTKGGLPGQNNQNYAEFQEHLKQRRSNADALVSGAQGGSLNKDEFISLGELQNGTDWLRATYLKDGTFDENERAAILERQKLYDELYEKYSGGDFHPATEPENDTGKKHLGQLGDIYDGISSDLITKKEGSLVLRSMNSESQAIGSGLTKDENNAGGIGGFGRLQWKPLDTQQLLDLFKNPGEQSGDFSFYDLIM